MIKLNREQIKDKIHACWTGKNIGGTIGGPYEGTRELLDITGFASEKGEPLPNDDLDLQLVWLFAMENVGPYNLTAKELGEYWLQCIPPSWNEYGTGKANMEGGLLPPLSGQYANQRWYHSNGAWIRSEIWACLAPGYPEIARRYAFEDGCVDHGMGEGTVAEQFTVTLESLAFFETDIRAIIEKALPAIPEDSRVAKAVRLVIDGFDRGDDWKDVRNALVKQSEDIGWFQAPANIGYVVLGLLYGEGDFKKSILYTINCGDDTDCTAGTVGAFLGILYGSAGIPADWAEYIGDKIISISTNMGYGHLRELNSCTVLTERVMRQIPTVFLANRMIMEYTDGENELPPLKVSIIHGQKMQRLYDDTPLTHPEYNFSPWNSCALRARVEYDREPSLSEGESLTVRVVFYNKFSHPFHADIKLHLPEGISATPKMQRLYIDHMCRDGNACTFTVTATEGLQAMNRIIFEADLIGHPEPVLFAIPILGK